LDDENNGKRQELIKTNEKVKEYAESAKDALSIQ
jgi:hypothetical protein